jgi:hypothetical protein
MKTKPLPKTPPIDREELSPDSLKAYFCGCALMGAIASQQEACPTYDDEPLVERAYRLGELMFEKYTEENPSVVRKFNRRLGL